MLDSIHLASRRIVSHNGADRRSRPYDILRTQVLQSMTADKWKILGVTSPNSRVWKNPDGDKPGIQYSPPTGQVRRTGRYGPAKAANSQLPWAWKLPRVVCWICF